MEPSQDRRRSKRYAEQLVVQWQRQASPESAPTEQWRYAFIKDISRGGMCFETAEALSAGELLYFKVKVHFSLWPFTCTGQVLRVRGVRPDTFDVAVAFLNIDPKDADLVDLLAWEQDQKKQGKLGS